ncbi:conserved exported hypothetical protein [Erythrobacter sp. EC-HK427]|nr:conserved exported hypothetical protein [Erythrobacter sp. EC-HK427]
MRKRGLLVGISLACVTLAACSESDNYGESAELTEADATTEAAPEAMFEEGEEIAEQASTAPDTAALETRPDIPITLPRMAYTYDYGFQLDAAEIAPLQERHADMCEAAGPYVCQIVSQSHSGNVEDGYASGRLELAVVADQAREFGGRLGAAATTVGGEQVTAGITGEDLTGNMVDTEARLRSRIALRDRMMEVLRTRQGSVEEIVEAERQVARINEEIDQARAWLEEMRGRVAFTRVNIDYSTASAPASSFLDPVTSALASIGGILGYLLAAFIVLASIAVPVGGAIWGVKRLLKRFDPPVEAEA